MLQLEVSMPSTARTNLLIWRLAAFCIVKEGSFQVKCGLGKE